MSFCHFSMKLYDFVVRVVCTCFEHSHWRAAKKEPESRVELWMPPPRRSHDVRPTSPASFIDGAHTRSSSEQATPRTRAPLGVGGGPYANDPSAISAAAHAAAAFAAGAAGSSSTNLNLTSSRRPNKPSISSSSSAGLAGSERDYAPSPGGATPSASSMHLGVRSGSRAEMYPARDTAASPVPSTCEFGIRK